jgi:rare lipoprotein A (peptidoglycan hydrolase)
MSVTPQPKAFAAAWVVAVLMAATAWHGLAAPALAAPSAAEIEAKRAEAARVRAALDGQRQQLAAGIARVEKVAAGLDRTQRAAEAEAARLAKLDRVLRRRQRLLNAFAVNSYRYGEASTLAAIVGAVSFDDFLGRLRYVTLIGDSHAQTIAWVKRGRAESSRLSASLRSRTARLAAMKAEADQARAGIQAHMSSQQQALDSLSSDVRAMLAQQEKASRPADSTHGGGDGGGGGSSFRGPTGGGDWTSMGSLAPGARARVEGRSGTYVIPAGVPGKYRPDGVSWDAEASQYSVADNGTGTSSGRPLDDGELTCAHKTLPMGTLIAVTHGGQKVIVVVTDRGPFSPRGRDIDLTAAAARLLGIDGTGQVHEEVVSPAN